jgi:steroid 5-alpha reductase family enzyme
MFDLRIYLSGWVALLMAGALVWSISISKRDVSIVDSLWPLFFVIAGITYVSQLGAESLRAAVVLLLVCLWAVRLSGYISWRNWGQPEDFRYQAIRANHQPDFELKSLFMIFLFQATVAWIVSMPLLGAMSSQTGLSALDILGVMLVCAGLVIESVADWQLSRFKAQPRNRGKVLAVGLWRYSRHPNYFGDFCVWWGFYLIALGAGAWWTIPGPLLMTIFLFEVSGVALLERDIGDRRPDYDLYVRQTNAFFPGLPRTQQFSEVKK